MISYIREDDISSSADKAEAEKIVEQLRHCGVKKGGVAVQG